MHWVSLCSVFFYISENKQYLSLNVINLLCRKLADTMKYFVMMLLAALMATQLQPSEDPLIPVGALVDTMVNHIGSLGMKVVSFAGLP